MVRLIEAQAAGSAADASSTAAVEAAAGALSRAFAAATVEAEAWAVAAITPDFLAQVGRDLVRKGKSLHVIQVDPMAGVALIPSSDWHWEGTHDPASWTVRATAYGPSTSSTWHLPNAGVVFVKWGSNPGQPYIGTAPTSWAHTTARLQSEAERSLADEASGPLAQLLAIPQDGGDGEDADPLKMLKGRHQGRAGQGPVYRDDGGGLGRGQGQRAASGLAGLGGWAPTRPSPWSRLRSRLSRTFWPRPALPRPSSSTVTAPASARPFAAGTLAP